MKPGLLSARQIETIKFKYLQQQEQTLYLEYESKSLMLETGPTNMH